MLQYSFCGTFEARFSIRARLPVVLATLSLLLGVINTVNAQSFTYQGYLRDGGVPANGIHQMTFRLFSVVSGGTALATVGPFNVTVSNGLCHQVLNFGNVWDGSERFLEIQVGATALAPRVKINATPYAIRAATAGTANPIGTAGGDLSGTFPNPLVVGLQGRSVANASPNTGQVLKWTGSAWAPDTDLRDQFWQASGSNMFYNSGKVGIGTSSPLYPLHVATGTGDFTVFVFHTATSGFTYGVWGQSASSSGTGVLGWATASSGFTNGGLFESASTAGRGVYGLADATSGTNFGVYGRSNSTAGRGVYGLADATSGTNFGVFGRSNSAAGYGVYSQGRFTATGTKSFQIDHPLNPETHYLNHFCTEAPEPLNSYSGNVVTDAQGYATVRLPDYFEAINRDVRYQLTCIGQFAQAIVAEKIKGNRFVVRTDKPKVEVSWRVEAIRNDRWVQEYGFQVELEKPKELQGKYLHPELYGLPRENGIHFHPDPVRPEDKEKPK